MNSLMKIEQLIADQPQKPPIDKWHPELSGDIDIVIKSDGTWWHEGDEIKRHTLVKLFASILRREDDNQYYLVTPVEKWRLRVEDTPFIVVDHEASEGKIAFKTNTDDWLSLGPDNPMELYAVDGQMLPRVYVRHGLWAKIGRAVFYRLIELASEEGGELKLNSSGQFYALGSVS